jgi:hypothetical protein
MWNNHDIYVDIVLIIFTTFIPTTSCRQQRRLRVTEMMNLVPKTQKGHLFPVIDAHQFSRITNGQLE